MRPTCSDWDALGTLVGYAAKKVSTVAVPALRPRINVFQIQNGSGPQPNLQEIGLLGDRIPAHAGLCYE